MSSSSTSMPSQAPCKDACCADDFFEEDPPAMAAGGESSKRSAEVSAAKKKETKGASSSSQDARRKKARSRARRGGEWPPRNPRVPFKPPRSIVGRGSDARQAPLIPCITGGNASLSPTVAE